MSISHPFLDIVRFERSTYACRRDRDRRYGSMATFAPTMRSAGTIFYAARQKARQTH